jgi:hypothetical protein
MLIVAQLNQNFFYLGVNYNIHYFVTRTWKKTLSLARSIQSISHHFTSTTLTLILLSHLWPDAPKCFLSFRILDQNFERIYHVLQIMHGQININFVISLMSNLFQSVGIYKTLPYLHMCKPMAYQRNRSIVPDMLTEHTAMTVFVGEKKSSFKSVVYFNVRHSVTLI